MIILVMRGKMKNRFRDFLHFIKLCFLSYFSPVRAIVRDFYDGLHPKENRED